MINFCADFSHVNVAYNKVRTGVLHIDLDVENEMQSGCWTQIRPSRGTPNRLALCIILRAAEFAYRICLAYRFAQ